MTSLRDQLFGRLRPTNPKIPTLRTALLVLGASACASSSETQSSQVTQRIVADTTFARLVQELSEPGGYFDTDNLISNETSYLHVVGKLSSLGVHGGAYIGVGPDQNFSYIAHVRPSIAFIVDIRRDNLLQHVLFKALFHLSPTRLDYLTHLFGRPPPRGIGQADTLSIRNLIDLVDEHAVDFTTVERIRDAVRMAVDGFGLSLTEQDRVTIDQIHDVFIEQGLDLRFNSFGRRPQPYYPTYRQLLLETDLTGRETNFLASEASYRVVRDLQERNMIIPVVGDLAGEHAVRAIGRYLAQLGEQVSFFYTSNVEFYLMRNGTFNRFADNVAALPRAESSVIARSYFGGMYRFRHPQSVTGYYSTQLLQTIESLVDEHQDGGYQSYIDLVTKHSLKLR